MRVIRLAIRIGLIVAAIPALLTILYIFVPPVSTLLTAPHGPFVDPGFAASLRVRVSSPALRNGRVARNLPRLPGPPEASPLAAGNVVNAYPSNLEEPWGVAFNTDAIDFWVSNSASAASKPSPGTNSAWVMLRSSQRS